MASRNRTLISGLKQLAVVAARVATANITVAEVSSGQKQNTTKGKSLHMGAAHEITGAWWQPQESSLKEGWLQSSCKTCILLVILHCFILKLVKLQKCNISLFNSCSWQLYTQC